MGSKPLIGILALLLWIDGLSAQTFEIQLDPTEEGCSQWTGIYKDADSWKMQAQGLRDCLLQNGYLGFFVDSLITDSSYVLAFNSGEKWQVDRTKAENSSEPSRTISEELYQWADAGHPFARIASDSLWMDGRTVFKREQLEAGPLLRLDSLLMDPDLRIPQGFLRHHFGLKKGDLFRQSTVDDLEVRGEQLEFMEFSRKPALLFTEQGAWIFLYPSRRKANRFDLLVGYNNEQGDEGAFSGQADIRLVNSFNTGEWIGLKWMAPPDGAQQLSMELGLPYLARSRFWLESNMELYRRDSSFFNVDAAVKLRYAYQAHSGISLVYRGQRSRVGGSEDLSAERSDVQKDLLGLMLENDRRNDLFSPSKGSLLRVEGSTGRRSAANTQNTQYQIAMEWESYIEMAANHIFRPRIQLAGMSEDGGLYQNELFRLGGRSSLRGFQEQSLFAARYAVGTIEYRYRAGADSYFQAFWDGAVTRDGQGSDRNWMAIGAGVSLELSNAFIQVDLAMPYSGTSFDARSSILHLGYTGRF